MAPSAAIRRRRRGSAVSRGRAEESSSARSGRPCSSLGDCADDPARIAGGEHGVRDISRHDAAGSDHGSRADPDARENDGPAADPYV